MTVSLPPATARRLGMRPTLGRRQASLSAAGRLMLRLPFAPRALARLGRLRSLRLRVAAVALDSQGRRFTRVRRLDCRGGKCAAT